MFPGNQSLIPEKFKIPPLPRIYFRIADAIHNPSLSISSIGDIIAKDGCLSNNILRMANHVICHPRHRIHSLKHLLLNIGREEIQAVVLGTFIPTLFKNIQEGLINIHTFWKHNIACGITARFIALYLNRTTPIRYFLAGLLHDIGKLILFQNMTELSKRILIHSIKNNLFYHIAEKETLDFDHAQLANKLLEKWHISETIRTMITYHHKPEDAGDHMKEASVLHIADIMVNGLNIGNSGTYFVPILSDKAWKITGLKPSVIPNIVKNTELLLPKALDSILPKDMDHTNGFITPTPIVTSNK